MIANDLKSKWALALRGLLSLIVGILIIARPMASVAALALVIAIWSLFDGVVNIVRSFTVRGVVAHWWVLRLGGIVSVAFGAVYAGVSVALRIPELPSIVGVMADVLRRPIRS